MFKWAKNLEGDNWEVVMDWPKQTPCSSMGSFISVLGTRTLRTKINNHFCDGIIKSAAIRLRHSVDKKSSGCSHQDKNLGSWNLKGLANSWTTQEGQAGLG